jgi:hypothetical protein
MTILNPKASQCNLFAESRLVPSDTEWRESKEKTKAGKSPDDTSRSCSGRVITPPELQAELARTRAAKI